MSLGNGEYIIISNCILHPYNYKSLNQLISKLSRDDVNFGNATFLDISPEEASYELIWEGVNEFEVPFLTEKLNANFLSSVDIIFPDKIKSRLQVTYLDEESYEVAIMFNFTELVQNVIKAKRNENLELIERIGIEAFEILAPVYGTIAVEKSVYGIKDLRNGEVNFPIDKVYYSKSFYNYQQEHMLYNEVELSLNINDGIYIRKSLDFS